MEQSLKGASNLYYLFRISDFFDKLVYPVLSVHTISNSLLNTNLLTSIFSPNKPIINVLFLFFF